MKDIYVNKEGVICACTVEVPKEPKRSQNLPCDYCHPYCECNAAKKEYESALQACKESAVPFEDQTEARHWICWKIKNFANDAVKPDTFYQIEADWEIVTVMSEGWQPSYNNPDNSGCEQPAEPIEVARLKVPAPTVATDNSGEKQKEILIGEFIDKFVGAFPDVHARKRWKTWDELRNDMRNDLLKISGKS